MDLGSQARDQVILKAYMTGISALNKSLTAKIVLKIFDETLVSLLKEASTIVTIQDTNIHLKNMIACGLVP